MKIVFEKHKNFKFKRTEGTDPFENEHKKLYVI